MTDASKNNGGNSVPAKQGETKPVKISSLSKEADEFMKKMDKKKAGPGDIASALEQWLNNE